MALVYLLLILLLIGVVVSVLLWVGSAWLQGYVYSEPSQGLAWRAPAAGAAVMVFLALWCFLDYRLADPAAEDLPFDTLWNFSPTETYPPKPWPYFWSVKNGKETEYRRQESAQAGGGARYLDPATRQPWSRESNGLVQAVIIPEGDQKVRFDLDLPGGKFKPGEPARYKEDDGQHRVLTENDVEAGQMSRFRFGLLLGNVVLNLLHVGVWFACLWLLLRFQWPHALGLAVVLWVVMMFAVFPPLLFQTKQAVKAGAASAGQRAAVMPLMGPRPGAGADRRSDEGPSASALVSDAASPPPSRRAS
jgi:hypothetical protein